MKKTVLLTSLLLMTRLATVVMAIQFNAGAAPMEQTGSLTRKSDKRDYQAGSTVTLTGTGWQSGESVHIYVNDSLGQTWSYNADVVADSGGVFTNQFQLPLFFVAKYSVTATGTLSGIATTSFTDAAGANIDQCAN